MGEQAVAAAKAKHQQEEVEAIRNTSHRCGGSLKDTCRLLRSMSERRRRKVARIIVLSHNVSAHTARVRWGSR